MFISAFHNMGATLFTTSPESLIFDTTQMYDTQLLNEYNAFPLK